MKIRHLRWWIVALLLLVSIKNYADRQMLPILAPTIQRELHLSDRDYGGITNLFLVAYTLSYLVSGRLVDALGSRLSLPLFIFLWSAAGALTGFARSAASVGWLRFVFGFGEAGGYAASPKVVAEWFAPAERGIASSIYSLGGSIGATVAPVATLLLASRYGWRPTFVLAGLLGGVMIVLWLWLYRSADARETRGPASRSPAPPGEVGRWKTILRSPLVWSLLAARMLTDPVWYFVQFWTPNYLHEARGFSQAALADLWLVFAAAGVGFLTGGWWSDHLVRSGRDPRLARLSVMAGCALLAPWIAAAMATRNPAGLLGIFMVVALACGAWLTNMNALIMDLIPGPIFGTAYGLIAAGSALGGVVMNQAVIWMIGRSSYDACFPAMAVLFPLAFLLLWRSSRRPLAGAA